MYETSGEQALLVGIPDVSGQRSVRDSESKLLNVAVAPSPNQPIRVTVPVPETIR
jgi:hypothetical protein